MGKLRSVKKQYVPNGSEVKCFIAKYLTVATLDDITLALTVAGGNQKQAAGILKLAGIYTEKSPGPGPCLREILETLRNDMPC
jgi:hypothetical protein